LLIVIAARIFGPSATLSLLVTCVGFTVASDILLTYLRRKKVFTTPFAAIVTGLILTLIIDPAANWYQILVICFAAMAIKNFVRIGNRHVLNPAASGLLIGWVLFSLNPSWWGATLSKGEGSFLENAAIYGILLLIVSVSCLRLGRYLSVLSYLAVYALSLVVLGTTISGVLANTLSVGVLFFAFLMLPEPMTSPVSKKRQLLYGAGVSLLTVLFVQLIAILGLSNTPDFSLVALLIGNSIFFKFR